MRRVTTRRYERGRRERGARNEDPDHVESITETFRRRVLIVIVAEGCRGEDSRSCNSSNRALDAAVRLLSLRKRRQKGQVVIKTLDEAQLR